MKILVRKTFLFLAAVVLAAGVGFLAFSIVKSEDSRVKAILEKKPIEKAKERAFERWTDPLGEVDLNEIYAKENEFREKRGEATKEAQKPLVINRLLPTTVTIFGKKLGDARLSGISLGFTGKYYSIFNGIQEHFVPATKVFKGVSLSYDDWDIENNAPSGRFKTNQELLEYGERIREDLKKQLGTELQEFRFFIQVWPWRPGKKTSVLWSGFIPEYYVSNAEEWQDARHAYALSRTLIDGTLVELKLIVTYYDEYQILLKIDADSSLAYFNDNIIL